MCCVVPSRAAASKGGNLSPTARVGAGVGEVLAACARAVPAESSAASNRPAATWKRWFTVSLSFVLRAPEPRGPRDLDLAGLGVVGEISAARILGNGGRQPRGHELTQGSGRPALLLGERLHEGGKSIPGVQRVEDLEVVDGVLLDPP